MPKKELCGFPTPTGPCTMEKGHRLEYHRHRVYESITWTIENKNGVTLDSGKGRVALNYAITKILENDEMFVIHVKKWKTPNAFNRVNDAAA